MHTHAHTHTYIYIYIYIYIYTLAKACQIKTITIATCYPQNPYFSYICSQMLNI